MVRIKRSASCGDYLPPSRHAALGVLTPLSLLLFSEDPREFVAAAVEITQAFAHPPETGRWQRCLSCYVGRDWPQRIRTSITGTKIRGPAIGRGAIDCAKTARKKVATSDPVVTWVSRSRVRAGSSRVPPSVSRSLRPRSISTRHRDPSRRRKWLSSPIPIHKVG